MKIKKSQLKTLIFEIVRRVLAETARGEWWLQDGYAQFADGEVGDSGHEGYVIEALSREIYEHFTGRDRELGYLGEMEQELFRALQKDGRLSPEEIAEWNNENGAGGPTEVIIKKLLEDGVYKDQKQAEDAVYIAWGSSNRDSRDYAMKYFGWKRMDASAGYITIQTWYLRPEDLEQIKRGIWDAIGGDEYESEGDEAEEEGQDDYLVEIEVRANNKQFSRIPLKVLEKAHISDLMDYRRELAWMREKKVAPVMDPVNFTPVA